MRESKTKKASKTTATQATFLPERIYPTELEGATADVVRVGDATWLRVDRIVNLPDPAMNRYTPAEWKEQRESFQRLGIRNAISVRRLPEGYWLEAGRHRVLWALEAGWAYVKADIDGAGNAGTSALWRLEENQRRKADRPLDQAAAWREMMDPKGAAMNQKLVAQWAGVSAATVSRRLRLLDIPRELAALVGTELEEATLEPLFSSRGDAALMEAALPGLLKAAAAKGLRDAQDVLEAMSQAWIEKELAIPHQHEAFTMDVVEDPAWKKAAPKRQPFIVKVPSRWNANQVHDVVFYRDPKAALGTAQAIRDRLEAERRAQDAKVAAAAAKAGKKVEKGPDGALRVAESKRRTLAERVPEQRTKVQLDLLARFVPAQLGFPAEMATEALARFVAHTGALVAIQDVEAASRALGLPLQAKEPGRLRTLHLTRKLFLERWAKDPVEGMKVVAVALFFQARGYTKQLSDAEEERLPMWLTGKTQDEATALAKQAIKDRDAGYRAVVDGAICDHCEEPATLRKGGINVCRSDAFREVNAKTLAARRLSRVEDKTVATATPASSADAERAGVPA